MSLWSAQSAKIGKESAWLLALQAALADDAEIVEMLGAAKAENDELLLLAESPENISLRLAYMDSHARELQAIFAQRQIVSIQDLQAQGWEIDTGLFKASVFGNNLILSP